MASKFLSTGQAAKLCSVTPDTILKWIRSGRLPARRTPGGHHRVDRRDLDQLLRPALSSPKAEEPSHGRTFQFCWQYRGKGRLLTACRECVVYQLRAHRCYELARLMPELRREKLFCEVSCKDCDYFHHVHDQSTNVLVITRNPELVDNLLSESDAAPFNIEFADGEYSCSAVVESFRPDFAVVDCGLGENLSWGLTSCLTQDTRVPFVRIVLAGTEDEFPGDCEHMIFGRIDNPFNIDDLAHCTARVCDGATEAE